ncbi:TROVE domain-containing protein [Chelatococcus sp.]|uniref:TROVE domain-containing protein n=1 Tax=Chelatococcus sp. TaxID=1953771 RepID=UPI001EC6600E|nr:TROVE domain-containing protein [Chelatococcus sp.]MBX3543216.1 TROVE domain-containing protein [Chelatococcus sp.]
MRLNVSARHAYKTFEGAPAKRISPEAELRRSVMACMLWEKQFYEDGLDIAARISDLSARVDPQKLADIAIEARHKQHLRHAPLLLLKALARHGKGALVSETIERVISRADEICEFLAIYWSDGRKPLSAQMKKGLARAFLKFDEYALAKYDRDGAVKLRDALFLCHAEPDTEARADLWRRLVDRQLSLPDTWEVALSGGADKKEAFERLIRERKLGYLALLRNLRNMVQAGCDLDLVKDAIIARRGADRVLPFRYVAAARQVPQLEPAIDTALCEGIASLPALPGKTVVLVDVSGSMDAQLSAKSDLRRLDAAAALASIIHGDIRVFSFSQQLVECPPRRGMSGIDTVIRSQEHGGTYLGAALRRIFETVPHDRLIVITDEQSHDAVPDPIAGRSYMINVASSKNGVGYGPWVHIDGFSENVIRYISEYERDDA